MSTRTKRSKHRPSAALATVPRTAHTTDPTTDAAVPDLLDDLADARGRRLLLRRLIRAAKKKGDESEVTRLRAESKRARGAYSDVRTKLVVLLGESNVAQCEATTAREPRSLEMLQQSDGRAHRRLTRGVTDAASFIRWHSIESPFACSSVFAAFDRIALGRAYLDEAKRNLDSESAAKVGSDLIAAGERALARVLEVEATTKRTGPTPIELALAARTDASTAQRRAVETTSPLTASLTRPTAPTTEDTTDPTIASHGATQGTGEGAARRSIDPDREGGASGLRVHGPGAGGHSHNFDHVSPDKPRSLESHTGSTIKLTARGNYVDGADARDDEQRVRVGDRVRVTEEPRHVRVATDETKKPTTPAAPSVKPMVTWNAKLGRFMSADEIATRSAVGGPPPHAAAELERLREQITKSTTPNKEKKS